MTEVALLPPVQKLAYYGRSNVPFRRSVDRHPRSVEMKRTLWRLCAEWPSAGQAMEWVKSSRRLPVQDYAEFRLISLGSISGRIFLSRRALNDPLTNVRLLGFHETGWSVGSTFEHVLIHEWGHALTMMALWRRYGPRHLDQGFSDFLSLLSARSGCYPEEAAAALSQHAQISAEELLAEAFVDADLRRDGAHPFSQALWAELVGMWPNRFMFWI